MTTQPHYHLYGRFTAEPAFSLRDLAALLRIQRKEVVIDHDSHQALWRAGAIERRKSLVITPAGHALIANVEAQAARFDAAFRLAVKQVRA